MNPNFRFRFLKKTVLACSQAIGPRDLKIEGLDEHVLQTLEHQLKFFPFWHRFGFLLGLSFLEWGMCLGGWGLIPLRFLPVERAQERLLVLGHTQIHPLRFFIHGLKVLICLASYTHPKVETHFGFDRQKWRENRRLFRDQLEWNADLFNHQPSTADASVVSSSDPSSKNSSPPFHSYPPTPNPLASIDLISPQNYLKWDSSEYLPDPHSLNHVSSSPFQILLKGKIKISTPTSPSHPTTDSTIPSSNQTSTGDSQ